MGQPATILVVDDESPITHMLSLKLQQRGYQTVTASDGEEGFDLASKRLPDLIVSDYQMPQLSGLEMCAKLRAHGPTAGIPVVMLTARGHRVEDEDLAKTNIRCVMDKPFSTKAVLAKIIEILTPNPEPVLPRG